MTDKLVSFVWQTCPEEQMRYLTLTVIQTIQCIETYIHEVFPLYIKYVINVNSE